MLAFVLVALVAVTLAAAFHARDMACDDAYITFRYARNLQEGYGLVWNEGGDRCEGYSNLTYVAGLAALGWLGVHPATGALVFACVGFAALVWLLWRCTAAAGPWRPLALAPTLLLFANGDAGDHLSRGLETVPFAALGLGQIVALAGLCQGRQGRWRIVAVAGLATLLFLTRPDGVLWTGCSLVAAWWWCRSEPMARRRVVLAGLAWLAAGGAYAAWKLAYFGHLLPNPFYLKSGAGRFAGIPETLAFARAYGPLLAAMFVGALVARRRAVEPWLCLAIAVPWLAYGSKIVHEIGFAHRFCWPLVPLLGLGAGAGLSRLTPGSGRTVVHAIAWVALLLSAAWSSSGVLAAIRGLSAPPPKDVYVAAFLRLGEMIRSAGFGSQIHLYCSHAGATPYVARAHHIDPAGLVDNGYSPRNPPEQRAAYEAALQFDVIDWHLFPASPGAATFLEDSRAISSTYLNRWCFGDDPDLDAMLRAAQSETALAVRRETAFVYMRILRDHATLVGEVTNGLQRWRSFVYVWKTSPRHDALVAHLSSRVDIPASAIDFDGWPR